LGKSVNKIQVSLKYYRNNGYCAQVPTYIYDIISLNSAYNQQCFRQKLYRKSKHIFYVQ